MLQQIGNSSVIIKSLASCHLIRKVYYKTILSPRRCKCSHCQDARKRQEVESLKLEVCEMELQDAERRCLHAETPEVEQTKLWQLGWGAT